MKHQKFHKAFRIFFQVCLKKLNTQQLKCVNQTLILAF